MASEGNDMSWGFMGFVKEPIRQECLPGLDWWKAYPHLYPVTSESFGPPPGEQENGQALVTPSVQF